MRSATTSLLSENVIVRSNTLFHSPGSLQSENDNTENVSSVCEAQRMSSHYKRYT